MDYGSNSQLRTKLMEYIKIVSKSFQDDLRTLLSKVVKQHQQDISESIIGELATDHEVADLDIPETLEELCEQISLPYYSKLILVFHEMFRNCVMRLLGCTYSLMLGFQQVKNLQVEKARGLI